MTGLPFIDLSTQRARIEPSLHRRLDAVLAHGRFIQGPEVAELESALSERTSGMEVIACASGTDALVMALMALAVRPGDGVLVPSFTFVATAEAVILAGATPVFCDVRPDTFNFDPDEIPRGIDAAARAGLRPVGVIPVDLFGQPAEYSRIKAHAAAAGLWVLADAAQSVGGSVDGNPVGSLAPLSATSFYPAKPLGCYGDGGAVFADSTAVGDLLRSIREHGQGADKYQVVRVGMTARLDTIQAAVLLAKLEVFDEEIERREVVASRYTAAFGGLATPPLELIGSRSVWAQYTIRVPDRDRVASLLAADGVPTAIYYPTPLHRQPPYREAPCTAATLPVSEQLSEDVLSLPMHPYLEEADQDRIIASVLDAVGDGR